MNALNGYQQLRCELVADPAYEGLSMGAGGALLFLRLQADRSRFESKILGAIAGANGLWTAEDAVLEVAMVEGRSGERSETEAMEMAGKWVADLRDAGLVTFGSWQAVLVVSSYNRDMGRTQREKTRYGAPSERGGYHDLSRQEKANGEAARRSGGTWDEVHGNASSTRAQVVYGGAARSPRPPPSPLGAEDGNGGGPLSVGGKGGVYSENSDMPNQTTKPNFQTPNPKPNQSANREDAGGGEGGGRGDREDFHSRIWQADVLTACQFACRQRSIPFNRGVLKRVQQYGEQTVRQAAEYVAIQMREAPHKIMAEDRGQKIGGPLLWSKVAEIAEVKAACEGLKQGGFLA